MRILFILLFYWGQITGRVTDDQHKGIEGASVSVLRVKDSSLYKILITDKQGLFNLDGMPSGDYCISVSAVGYAAGEAKSFVVGKDGAVNLGDLRLTTAAAVLHQVEVTGKRPLIEIRPDRTILNVDASISNVGATALEVLQKSPGVTVDKDGNISLKGKQGVMVMLDGKPSYLSGADLAALLGSMSASQLDQIEIMTNPPAKYDAAGNAGIINIRTKKNKGSGFNGSLTLGYGQGRYWKSPNSLNLNYRNAGYNIFLSYTSNEARGYTDLHIIRHYLTQDSKSVTAIFDEPTYIRREIANNTLKLGMDFYLSKKTMIGTVVSGFISPRNSYGEGDGFLEDAGGITDSSIHTTSSNKNRVRNGAINLNFRTSFDSTSELSADADYVVYDGSNRQLFINSATHPGGMADTGVLRGLLPSVISIWSGKADYSQSLGKGGPGKAVKLEAGWKSSYIETNNTANYSNLEGSTWVPDYGKTNDFIYRENINAAYVNLNKEAGKWSFQAGVRFENTNYHGHQLGNPQKPDSSFTRHYNDLFPTVFISYQADVNNQFTLSTGRRIDRPVYQDLNPFLFYVNQYTYQKGNPFLGPQYTNNVELSHIFKGVLTSAVSYGSTRDYFTQIFQANGDTTTFSNGNLGRLQVWGVSVDAQLAFTDWWSATLHANGIYKKLDGFSDGDVVRTTGLTMNFSANNQFKLGHGWSAELSGNYNARDIEGQFDMRPSGVLTTGVSKQVLGGKGTIKMNVQDWLHTLRDDGFINYQNVREHFIQKMDSRVVNISFTYRFGKVLKNPPHHGNGGAGEEQNRVKF